MDTTDLRDRLCRLAERTAPPAADARSVVRGLVARHRAQRRQRLGVGAAVVAVAAVVGVVPAVLGDDHPATTATGLGTEPPAADVVRPDTRGSLAGDAAFVDGIRQLSWTDASSVSVAYDVADPNHLPDPPVGTRRVVFAGDVAGERWALVVGENTAHPQPPSQDPQEQADPAASSHVAAAWFTGPAGATPAQMVMASLPQGIDTTRPLALADEGTGGLVVVSAQGDTIELSLRPEVAADGTVRRSWQAVDAPDGVAVADLSGDLPGSKATLRFRVVRDGSVVLTTPPASRGRPKVTPPVELGRLRPPPAPAPGDAEPARQVQTALDFRLGLSGDQVAATVLWAGDIPAPSDRRARLSLVAVTVPSGAVYLTSSYEWGLVSDEGAGGDCGDGLAAAGTPLDQRTTVLHCDPGESSDGGGLSSLVVVAPPAAVTARALDRGGAVLGEFPMTDGALVAPFPAGTATVDTLAADGSLLGHTAPLTRAALGD
jgi:hypothetical protein